MYKRIGLVVIGAALVASMTACGRNAEDSINELDRRMNGIRTQSTQSESNLLGRANRDDHIHSGNDARNDYMLNARDIDKQQEQLLQKVRKVNGVNDATLFVTGNDIVVGLDVDSNAEAMNIENRVKQVLQNGKSGYNVHVTSDGRMHDRIREIKGQMIPMDGHPIRNLAQDITTLLEDMGRVVTEPLR